MLLHDFRYAIRSLKHRPGYTVAAVLALALGVGANTAMYSIAQGILFRPLPLKEIDRIVVVEGGRPERFDELPVSAADVMDIRERTSSFQLVSAASWWSVSVTGEGYPEQAQGFRVTPDFFEVIAVQSILGRTLSPADFLPSEENRVIVISEQFWERKFARNPKVLGQVIRLGGEPYTVVGVAPRWARVPAEAELWAPVLVNEKFRDDKGTRYTVYARLKDGVTQALAAAEVKTLAQKIAAERPNTNAGRDLRVALLRERISGNLTAEYTLMSMVAASLLLLIAASNVANLLFAILSGRAREIALRQALGSSRWRIARQLLVESVVWGLASVPAAFVLALWALDLNKTAMPAEIEIHLPGWHSIGLNPYAMAFGIGSALLTAVLAGLLPAWLGSRSDLNAQLREGGRSLTASGGRGRARSILVVVQVTLSMILMGGAALMYRGATALAAAAPGLNPQQVLTADVSLPARKYPTVKQRAEFSQKVLDEARRLPGVEAAALIYDVPFTGWRTGHVETDDTPAALNGSTQQLPEVNWEQASAGFFSMMGIPIVKGRDLADSDNDDSQQVTVISELAARQLFGGADPIGKRVKLDQGPWATVVGVSGDVMQSWLLRRPLPTVYRPYRQVGGSHISMLLRARSKNPEDLAPAWRAAMMKLDPDLPLFHVDNQAHLMSLELVGLNYITGMLGVTGILALLLAVVGVYSLMSFTSTERTREVGIRMAMGARPGEVVRLLVGQGFRMVGIGLVLGLVGAMALSRVFASLLYGVQAFDPVSIGLGAAALSFGAWLACYIPARWASRVDPMEALRHD